MITFAYTYITHDIAIGATTTLNITAIGEAVLKTGDYIEVVDSKTGSYTEFVLNADQGASDTTLTVVSKVTTSKIRLGSVVNISYSDLAIQYQRKTHGTIGGMPVLSKQLGPIFFDTPRAGDYSIIGVDPTYVKILPRDFLINEDGGYEALEFKDATNTGLQVGDSAQEMIATVNIPYGTTATEVYVWGSVTTKVVEAYVGNVNANGIGSAIGTGTTNGSAISITGTASTETNYLLIIVKVTATSNRIYGGKVTLTQN